MFTCETCKIELPNTQKFTRHGEFTHRELCGDCFTKWALYSEYITNKYEVPTISEYFKEGK